MKPITQKWIKKAEGDWNSGQREVQVQQDPNYDLVCFSAQQCAEKYLKARLEEAGIPFRRTHDLLYLLNLILPAEPSWNSLIPETKLLNAYAVDYRYPGVDASLIDAQDAMESCRKIREAVRQSFGLPI